ncbi:MAG: hypothetical protein IJD83_06330 [Clostridia bacterium]|nr:hypothetical protein [Clostridia bacterium]
MNFGASDPLQDYQISSFAGVDFSTLENKVHMSRSPDSVNMIINTNGYLEKRTGYRRLHQGEAKVNGLFSFYSNEAKDTIYLMHAGTKLYRIWFMYDKITKTEFLMDGLKDTKSRHFVFGGKLYIIGAGYVQVAYRNGGLEYGIVKDIGTSDEIVEYAWGSNVNSAARFKAKVYELESAISTKTGAAGTVILDVPQMNLPSTATSVKIEKVYVRVKTSYHNAPDEGTWVEWNLQYVSITDSGKAVRLLGNPMHGANVQFTNYFTYDAVKVVYHEESDVYAPLMFINRTAIPLKRYSNEEKTRDNSEYIADYDAHASEDWVEEQFRTVEPLDGDMVDSANFAHGRRKVQFKVPESTTKATCAYMLYLTGEKDKAIINRITIDGATVHDYMYTHVMQYAPSLTQTGVAAYVSRAAAIEADEDGRFIRLNEFVSVKEYSNSSNERWINVDVNTNMKPGSVIEVDFTVLHDADSDDEQINDCSIFGIYGGNNDTRVFLSGNPKFKNRDYASGLYDATYFSNGMYTDVGSEMSAIVGYQKLYSNQIVVKDDVASDASQYLRSLSLSEDGTATYTLLQGSCTFGANCISSFKYVGGVPFYIGPGGVYTIAGTTVQNQNNTTLRSIPINKRLLKENLEAAVCCRYDNYYVIAVGTHMWICDTVNNMEWFYFDSLPEITCLWTHGKRLYFGTADGRVCYFSDREEESAYYDNVGPDGNLDEASPVKCHWCTPVSAFDNWNMLKTVVNVYLSCMPYNDSSVHVYYNSSDDMDEDITTESIALFDFADINFGNFSFDGIRQPKPFATGVKAKNVYVFGIKLENAEAQPFGIVSVGYKYRYSKYVK